MESLTRRGHCVKVIDFEARWKPGNITNSMKRREIPNVTRSGQESPVTLVRPGFVKARGISRISCLFSQFRTIFEYTLQWCDVIVLYSVPTNGIQTVISAGLASRPVVFHSLDVLHDMTGYSFLRAPTWTLERFVYRRADKVVVISTALRDYMKSIGVKEQAITVLPPAVDTFRFNPNVSGRKFRDELGILPTDKVVLFSGWLYEFSGLDLILRNLPKVMEFVPNVRLVVCGDGPLLNRLREMRDELELENYVRIIGRRPYRQMPSIISSADVCINPYGRSIVSKFSFPSKIAEYMASGKAVLATDLPGTESLLDRSSGVWLVRPEEMIETLTLLLLDDSRRTIAGQTARDYSEKKFSLESVTDKFEELLTALPKKRSRWDFE